MQRRIGTTGKSAKTARPKAATKRRTAVKPGTGRPAAAGEETEIGRLRAELHEALDRQAATAVILKTVASSRGDLQEVFEAILENATRICEADFGILYRFDAGALRAVALRNAPPDFAESQRRAPIFPSPGSGLDRIISTRRPVHIVDVRQERPYKDGDPYVVTAVKLSGSRSLVLVPMVGDDEIVGAITIYRKKVRPFTDKQIDLVQNFAAQAVIAIENARLVNELRESLDQQTATAGVLRVISSSPGELEPVFLSILDNATRICQANFGTLFLREGEALRVAAHHGSLTKAWDEQWGVGMLLLPDAELQAFQTLAARQTIQVADPSKAPSYLAHNPKAVNTVEVLGIRTMVTVPMLKDGAAIGVITIFRTEVREFTDQQIALVTNFAAQAVIAIENARLLSELRQSLEQQTATAEVLGVINASRGDLQPVFEAMVDKARRLCEADSGHLALPVGDDYRSVAVSAMSHEMELLIRSVSYAPGRGTAVGRALAERRPVQISDIGSDTEHAARHAAGFIRTILGVPLLREGEAIGAFGLSRQRVEPFSERQIELVRTFAEQAVIAIENARLFEAEQQRTKELAKSLEDLRTAQDRLVQTQKLASLGQLTAGIAHEIKNPLNFVNNFSGLSVELIDELTEALAKIQLDEQVRADIAELSDTLRGNMEKIVQHGKRADSIVKNMLLHSREGSGERRPVDVNAIVEESLNLAYHGARTEKQGFTITLERSYDTAAGEVDVFPQDITRVLLNVLANGFYAATKRNGPTDGDSHEPTIVAATRSLGDRVEIRIRDNGNGIPSEVKDKIFNPFFTTKPTGEGTGLGLSISHDIIVKQHGGTIDVDTKPGEFTEFRIILPRSATIAKLGEHA
jgi:GAF domain-containing protein